MSDGEIAERLASLRALADGDVEQVRIEFQRHIDAVSERLEAEVDELLMRNGKSRCPTCDGFGKLKRLDAGYMRRFGMREWDGCHGCGGDGNERPGRGFVTDALAGLTGGCS